ncbi:DUF3859 domain-containing protein [Loktanella sp. Alg231-35]|uniref:DUF3859 domain-containing protein n=1 Tax=Loktanella sp. Alg231-35 TaxID=1922220 RepID=UPI000D55F2D6|nr:DUF3859 domain-containing protein [Loktanella sp. Alg231-35]
MLRYLLLFLMPVSAFAEAETSETIASVEAGLICPPAGMATSPAPGTLAGTTHIIAEEPPFAALTQTVPAVLGLGFGIKSQSTDIDGLSDVLMVVEHPPMGSTQTTQQSFFTNISGIGPSLTFYQFDHNYELVLGTWKMIAFHGDEVLFSTQFEVVHPRSLPELAQLCHYRDLLS